MLNIENLNVEVDSKPIINGLFLNLKKGQVNALMGQNGSGKSTLAQTLMGNPSYSVKDGMVNFDSLELLSLSPDERALSGLFLSFQYPSEIPGVKVYSYLRMIYNNSHEEKLSPVKFRDFLKEKMELLELDDSFTERFLNEGFSGGEKKRMEMLQMLVLGPKLAILDEVDSGLDVDAIKIVSKAVNYLVEKSQMSVLLITHYSRILKYIQPDFVHIMENGKIIKTGDKSLADEIEESGYENLK